MCRVVIEAVRHAGRRGEPCKMDLFMFGCQIIRKHFIIRPEGAIMDNTNNIKYVIAIK